MKNIFFILTIILFSGLNCNHALARGSDDFTTSKKCNELDYETEIIFKYSYGKLTYNTTLNQKSLTALAQKQGAVEKGAFAHGLATARVEYEISVDSLARLAGDDVCVVPSKVNFYLGYVDPVIYISSDLEKNSCEYYAAMRHEEAHQQINKTTLDYYLPKIKAAFDKISEDVKPIMVKNLGDVSEATSIITEEFVSYTKPLVAHYSKALNLEHSKLDNYENYEYENKLCK